jgi:hypothetical protein
MFEEIEAAMSKHTLGDTGDTLSLALLFSLVLVLARHD